MMDVVSHATLEQEYFPTGWSRRTLQEVAQLINGRGFKPHEWKAMGLPIIRIQNLNGSPDFNYYAGRYDPKIEVEPSQLLFAWSGSRGTSFGPHIWNGPLGVLNYHTWKVLVKETEIVPSFFFHVLKHLTKIIEDQAHGASALVHVQKWEMEKFPFEAPDDPAEQQAIAEALSDADGVVEGLERLIEKKRRIKQGAMQDLLTAKRRLPGFSGEWETKTLGDLAHMKSGEAITSARIFEMGTFPVFGGNGRRGFTDTFNKDGECTLIGRQGALCGAVVHTSGKIFASEHAIVCKATLGNSQGFLSHVFEYLDLNRVSEASAQPGLSVEKIRKIETVAAPTETEQEAISGVLNSMDAEITALENRLQKARAIKEGMMQNLLTGRIRLV